MSGIAQLVFGKATDVYNSLLGLQEEDKWLCIIHQAAMNLQDNDAKDDIVYHHLPDAIQQVVGRLI